MTTDLALTRPDPTLTMDVLKAQMEAAKRFVDSGLLPAAVKTPQQALILMQTGRELGIPATVALRGIVVVNGKPTCSAELMMALVHRAYGQGAMRVYKTTNESCTVQYRQAGWDGISEYTFTIEDAEKAGLFKNPVWKQYPAAMLRARAISATVRFAFPECISGVYLPEEMGATVDVVDGEVVPVSPSRPTPDLPEGPSYCDEAHFNRAWHAAVKGTRFEDDATRHKFVNYYTNGQTESLTEFLKGATEGEATDLISSIQNRIAAEARKAGKERSVLIDRLDDAVRQVNEMGGSMDLPGDISSLPAAEIQELLDHARAVIERAEAMAGTPA